MSKNPTQLNQIKTPKLRFLGFEGVWKEKKIGQVLKIGSGKDYKHLNKGDIPVFGTGGYMVSVDKSLYSGESVMIGRKGTIDKPFYFNGDFWTVDTLFYTYDFNGILPKFTETIFKKINWQKYNEASGVPSLSKATIEKIKINLPQLPEQQKIASFLGSVDEWIANLRAQHAELVSYKKGMMQKIFSREMRFKDDKGNDFPEWEEKRLGEIGKSYNGLSGKSGEDFGEGEPFITYKQIFDSSELNINNFALVKVESNEKQNKAQFGDVFFTTSSETPLEVGFASVLLDKGVNPYLNSFSFGFRFNSFKEFDPHFAKFFFRTSIFRREVVKLAQGSTRYNISKIEFMKMKFNFPSLPEQQNIAEFLSSVDQLLESKQQQITEAENWKRGLMQGLFV